MNIMSLYLKYYVDKYTYLLISRNRIQLKIGPISGANRE